jgi:flagellar motility protein MotE (MotC chaperone)
MAQDDMVKFIESKRAELNDREERLKKEEQRLTALQKDVDEKIDRYTKLLAQIETALKRLEQARQNRVESVVKAYESMAPEEAASRLSVLDDQTALLILQGMKSKKAGLVMAAMEPRRAAHLTRRLTAHRTTP